jgi:hypothetical protein
VQHPDLTFAQHLRGRLLHRAEDAADPPVVSRDGAV